MSLRGKVLTFLDRNIVLVVGIPMIISVHWGWSVLQENPKLVNPSEKKEIPIIRGIKYLKDRVENNSFWQKGS